MKYNICNSSNDLLTWTIARVEGELVNSEASITSLALDKKNIFIEKNDAKKYFYLEVYSEVPDRVQGDLARLPLWPRSVETLGIQEPDLECRDMLTSRS